MKINVLRKMRYQNTFIYVMQFGFIFQYLFSLNGEIYQNYITLKPNLFKQILWKIGRLNSPYSRDEIDEGEKAILSGAMASVDQAIKEGVTSRQVARQKEREYQQIQKDVKARSGKPCLWQAVDSNEGFYYRCLTHGMGVKMKDGEKPVHDVLFDLGKEEAKV